MPQPRGSVPCGGDILHAAATSRTCRRRPAAVRLFGVLGHVPDASGCPSEPFVQTQPDTEVAALHANLVNNLAGLMPVDAPTDAAGPAARVGDKRPRTEEEPEEVE
jgi:hypothetical protein